MAVLDDLHEVVTLAGGEAVRTEVVEDQQIDLGQHSEEAREAAIPVGELELCEEARHARVIGAVTLAAGPLSKGAINRYGWTSSIGIAGRHHSVRPALGKIRADACFVDAKAELLRLRLPKKAGPQPQK